MRCCDRACCSDAKRWRARRGARWSWWSARRRYWSWPAWWKASSHRATWPSRSSWRSARSLGWWFSECWLGLVDQIQRLGRRRFGLGQADLGNPQVLEGAPVGPERGVLPEEEVPQVALLRIEVQQVEHELTGRADGLFVGPGRAVGRIEPGAVFPHRALVGVQVGAQQQVGHI